MRIALYQIDAFAERLFEGNPAAVCPMGAWLDDTVMQAIAAENNLAETAFFVQTAPDSADLRWFTPRAEVDLCGHATLASAHVWFEHLGHTGPDVTFHTRSGALRVQRAEHGLRMDFPAVATVPCEAPAALAAGLGGHPEQVLRGMDLIAVFADARQVLALDPDFRAIAALDTRGVVATAPGDDCDFVSRCFYPGLGIDEDPVTGSAHCALAPYWAHRLGRDRLHARQLSRRGGALHCEVHTGRVLLEGRAVDYLVGEIAL
ncbi:PhzF family phenazine biosynthesis protein [Thiomonas bhubaneswarensis]|uniref:Phenazine biosynthesis protein PhzF family n=1 Tax=Thiomonas bhubaneswarensis TaxID=339866 RepID=A0A0K6I049_9BURK|nr:PhzF family phenazine biosynthesis protein [Thiomonas bhubaneswarensis]CUA96461.1 phenazine biosynthesis protein PhzF family [Thiomonas bhubaneswarensis]